MNRSQSEGVPVTAANSQGQAEREAGSEVGDAPDISASFEALLWRSSVFGGVQLDTSSIDARFVHARLQQIGAGVRGRGKVELDHQGRLTVQFGMSTEEVEAQLLDDYVDHLVAYLRLPDSAVVDVRIATGVENPEVDARADRAIRRLGVRALK